MISLDTETTGIDFHHGARPFFVTTCDEEWNQQWWEWEVDPLTRQPRIPEGDPAYISMVLDLSQELDSSGFVLQNAKFDAAALKTIGVDLQWSGVHDTLLAGHLLASNQRHDLTSMTLHYLGVDIQPLEKVVKEACEKCRRIARSKYKDWRIARRDLTSAGSESRPEMPSAKESTWAYDMWLPRSIARVEKLKQLEPECEHKWGSDWLCTRCKGHRYWCVTSDYSNADSSATLALWVGKGQWHGMANELHKRGLWEIYLERRKILPIIFGMEQRGIAYSIPRSRELRSKYLQYSVEAEAVCTHIAEDMCYPLVLPKGGNNHSLTEFCFSAEYLSLPVLKRTETGQPSLDKATLDDYAVSLPEGSVAHTFIKNLRGKRKRDKSIEALNNYERYAVPYPSSLVPSKDTPSLIEAKSQQPLSHWRLVHPSLNPTGTDTLRMSSSNPNGQNVSKLPDEQGYSLRYCYGPGPGREWWPIDYENIELRIPCYESGEQAMIELFERPDDPPYYGSQHLLYFDLLHPEVFAKHGKAVKEIPEIKATLYQWVKNGDFAIQYGAQKAKADATYHVQGAYDLIKSRFAKLDALNRKYVQMAEKLGYVETLPDKTVCPERGYPVMCTRTDYGRILPTVPLNYHVQSTAMWCTMKAMIRCQAYLNSLNKNIPPRERAAKGYFIALQVHDEIVFDLPKGGKANLPIVLKLKQLMEQSGDDIGIPLRAAWNYCPVSWSKHEDPMTYQAV